MSKHYFYFKAEKPANLKVVFYYQHKLFLLRYFVLICLKVNDNNSGTGFTVEFSKNSGTSSK